MILDYARMCLALARLASAPHQKGKDLYLEAVREVTGNPKLELTPEQRKSVKNMMYSYIYSDQFHRDIQPRPLASHFPYKHNTHGTVTGRIPSNPAKQFIEEVPRTALNAGIQAQAAAKMHDAFLTQFPDYSDLERRVEAWLEHKEF